MSHFVGSGNKGEFNNICLSLLCVTSIVLSVGIYVYVLKDQKTICIGCIKVLSNMYWHNNMALLLGGDLSNKIAMHY